MRIHGLILAAGNSARLGHAKQLVKYNNQTLLADIEKKLLESCAAVFVVLGHQAERFGQEIKSAQIINNPNWQAGMGQSLAHGANIASQQADGLLVALCDQPLINLEHYLALIKTFNQNPEHIVATQYQRQLGVPVVFPARLYEQLLTIKAKAGAQSIIINNSASVLSIPCEAASYDVDTVDDLSKLDNSSVG